MTHETCRRPTDQREVIIRELYLKSSENIRTDGYVYIDKTAFVHKIATSGKYYFLSRPRRFGKSLLLTTLEAYFKGKKELFEGLTIEGKEKEWKEYPVLKLSLNVANFNSLSVLINVLNDAIDSWCKLYGINATGKLPSIRFKNAIIALHAKTGRKVVILLKGRKDKKMK